MGEDWGRPRTVTQLFANVTIHGRGSFITQSNLTGSLRLISCDVPWFRYEIELVQSRVLKGYCTAVVVRWLVMVARVFPYSDAHGAPYVV